VSLVAVTPDRPGGGENGQVVTAPSAGTRWAGRGHRLVAARYPVAVLLGLSAVVESVRQLAGSGANGRYVLLLGLLALATTAPLALRAPTAAALAVTAAGALSLAAFDTLTVAGALAQVLVAYRLGRRGWAPAAVLLGLPYLLLAVTDVLALTDGAGLTHGLALTDSVPRGAVRPGPDGAIVTAVPVPAAVWAVTLAALVPAAAVAGIGARMRREDARRRAAQHAIAGSLIEHTARGERARIARELHDVVAHHISMIAVQAESARLTTPGLSPAGAQRLSAIGDTARTALTEMRRLLGVLREDARDDAGGDAADDARGDRAGRRPQPGLAQLNELLDEARDATGAGTRLILHGPPVSLDPGVELAAYRIVQEALTNCRRHAPGAAVDVELTFTDTALRLVVRDNGPGSSTSDPAAGHGLLGMRERAAAVGGALRAGSASTSGFLVEAILPTDHGAGR